MREFAPILTVYKPQYGIVKHPKQRAKQCAETADASLRISLTFAQNSEGPDVSVVYFYCFMCHVYFVKRQFWLYFSDMCERV